MIPELWRDSAGGGVEEAEGEREMTGRQDSVLPFPGFIGI